VTVLAVGFDLVDVAGFAEQLADGASGFLTSVFTSGEQRDAAAGAGPAAVHLAGRYAAKEALVKAWSGARFGHPPALARVDLREIEVVRDGYGRPRLRLHGAVASGVAALAATDGRVQVDLSLSHDGAVAGAVVVLSVRSTSGSTA
jgi:holo-[acyl-carrier protein] synthase